ncbi:hypothetical protein EDD18DRAFT_1116386 [Armillaria luteobubalina]|uniref:JmjC domain-containing protein n=1 Tax=Armillaria luteobubalina TaxID=153913 RepID=A0AA39NZR6_9AGAR|nr:hypothetical protein EDD18DRAFT_1116386 [Armillaria luteobubalina]
MTLSLLDGLVAAAECNFGQSINVVYCPFEVPARGSRLEPLLKRLQEWPSLIEESLPAPTQPPSPDPLQIPAESHTTLTLGTDNALTALSNRAAREERPLCDGLLLLCDTQDLTQPMRKFLSIAIELRMMANVSTLIAPGQGGRSEYIALVDKFCVALNAIRLYQRHSRRERLLYELQSLTAAPTLLFAATHISPLVLFYQPELYATHLHLTQYGYKRASKYVRPPMLRDMEQRIWQTVLVLAAGFRSIQDLSLLLREFLDAPGVDNPTPTPLEENLDNAGAGPSGQSTFSASCGGILDYDDPTESLGVTDTDMYAPDPVPPAQANSPAAPPARPLRVTRSQMGHLPGRPALYQDPTPLPPKKRQKVRSKTNPKSVAQPTVLARPALSQVDPSQFRATLQNILPTHLRSVNLTRASPLANQARRAKARKNIHNERDEHSTSITAWTDAEQQFRKYTFRLLKIGSDTETGFLDAIKSVDINRLQIQNHAAPIHVTNPDAALVRHMDHASYLSLTAAAVQAILEKQSILIYGVPDSATSVDFDERGLQVLGALDELRSVQSFSKREVDGHANCHLPNTAKPTLRLMLHHARAGDNGQVLNALEFPLGGKVLKSLPNHQGLASEKASFERTEFIMAGAHALSWGLCGLATSSTHQHRDSHGLPTHVSPLCGSKIWVMLRHSDASKDDCNFYRDYLDQKFRKDESIQEFFESEVLYLDNTTHLIMKPNVLHYVLTLEHSVSYGGHFIPSASIRSVVIGYVHTAFLTYNITNTLHPEIKRLLFRMLLHWCLDGTTFQPHTEAHLPNWTSPKSLLDIIAIGNLVLYARALDPTTDLESNPSLLVEWLTARDTYVFAVAAFQRVFATEGISDVFFESAKRFGASLFDYMTSLDDDWELHPDGISSRRDTFEKALGDALDFQTAQVELGWVVEQDFFQGADLLEKDPKRRALVWEPSFSIHRRRG